MKIEKKFNHLVLGILGSGQLARMSAIAASELGISTSIYCSESETSPAEHVALKTFKGKLNDKEKILNFAKNCDFLTLENEFIDQDILDSIDQEFPGRLFPHSKTFKLIGDKISEKENFKKAGINVVPFAAITCKEDILDFIKNHDYPIVLKSAKGGYDGYGNFTIKNESEIEIGLKKLKANDDTRLLLIEAFIPYEKELAIMVVRNADGEILTYPIAHTIQEDHICHYVSVPANITQELEIKIKESAITAMKAIDAIGIFAFEFFLTANGELYLNESAPRPHNSGHYTIEGTVTSQFHNHIRSVLNLPLGGTSLRAPHILMLNLLGTQNGPASLSPLKSFFKIKDGHLHLYAKTFSKLGRKMGHFTVLGNNENDLFSVLKKIKSEYSL